MRFCDFREIVLLIAYCDEVREVCATVVAAWIGIRVLRTQSNRGRGRENDRGRGGHGRGGGDPGRGGWGRGRASKAAPKGDALAKHVELKQKEAVAIQQSAPQPPAVAAAVRPVLPVQQPVFHPWHPAQLAMPVQNPFGPFRGAPGGGGYGGGYAGGYGGAQPLCPEWHYRGCCQAGSGCAFFHPPFPLLH